MRWLITYEYGCSPNRTHKRIQNEVITEEPLKWLKRMLKKFPDAHYVLLFALKVSGGGKKRNRKSTGAGKKHGHRSGPDDSQGIHF